MRYPNSSLTLHWMTPSRRSCIISNEYLLQTWKYFSLFSVEFFFKQYSIFNCGFSWRDWQCISCTAFQWRITYGSSSVDTGWKSSLSIKERWQKWQPLNESLKQRIVCIPRLPPVNWQIVPYIGSSENRRLRSWLSSIFSSFISGSNITSKLYFYRSCVWKKCHQNECSSKLNWI